MGLALSFHTGFGWLKLLKRPMNRGFFLKLAGKFKKHGYGAGRVGLNWGFG
jgi:hypothetical protein